jgi:hypothetical protein
VHCSKIVLLNHLVGAGQQSCWNAKSKALAVSRLIVLLRKRLEAVVLEPPQSPFAVSNKLSYFSILPSALSDRLTPVISARWHLQAFSANACRLQQRSRWRLQIW